jgi:uncharacterized protein YcbX
MHYPAAVRVQALWRYPVKSMGGEQLDAVALDDRGVAGDRRYAVRVASGKLGSGKSTPRFQRVAGLLDLQARHEGDRIVVTAPSGDLADGLDALLSAALGEDVALVHDADDPFVDRAPVHLVTTASLAWLRARLPATAIDERRVRPNLLVEAPGEETLEDRWVGRTLRVGEDVELAVTDHTRRCVMTNLAQQGLEEDPAVLRTIAANDLRLGVYASVVRAGIVRRGDPVMVL